MSFQKLCCVYYGKDYSSKYADTAQHHFCSDNFLQEPYREKKSEQAENLLLEYLSKGKYPQQALLKKAQAVGISKRVLDEAKKELNVRSL